MPIEPREKENNTVAIFPLSALKAKLYTPLLWPEQQFLNIERRSIETAPVKSNALAAFSKSPLRENFTSQTFTSGVNPDVATNLVTKEGQQ